MGTVIVLRDDSRFDFAGFPMRFGRLFLLLCALVAASCSSTPQRRPGTRKPDTLILISIDGFRADYLNRGLTPALSALAAKGVRATSMRPSFPTLTFPNHYTLVTGLTPDHHGIVNNRMVDPRSGHVFVYKDSESIADPAWWGGEPVWVSAEKQGLRAATMFWPGSDVAIEGIRPSAWLPFDGKRTPDQRVDQLLRWIDLPPAQRATFFTLYFDQVDHAGHAEGPDSAELDTALRSVDDALARLLAGLERRGALARTNLVIVSDHGMTQTSRDRLIFLDDVVPDATVDVINYGILAGMNPRAGATEAAERSVLGPQEHMHCWRKSQVPARLRYGTNPRIPALLCLAEDGWIITSHALEAKRTRFSLGEHGYDNDDPDMSALFLAEGPAFRRGIEMPRFDNVDVYPLLMHLLGLQPQPNDGDFSVVAPMLRQP